MTVPTIASAGHCIKCATNKGDVVLDPFMGDDATITVAEKPNRKWIGIDQSVMAVKVTEQRLQKLCHHFETIMCYNIPAREAS